MSKLIPLLLAGACTATVSVGGFYLVKNSGGAVAGDNSTLSNLENMSTPSAAVVLGGDLTTFGDLSTFENNNGGSCVQHVFGVLDFGSKAGEIAQGNSITDVDFSSEVSKNDVKSCLVVNWEKTDYSVSASQGK